MRASNLDFTEGRIQSFNKAATTIFGYAPAEIIGRKVALLVRDEDGTPLHSAIALRRYTASFHRSG